MQTAPSTRSAQPLRRQWGGFIGFVAVLIAINLGLYGIIPTPAVPTIHYVHAGQLDLTQLVDGAGWESPEGGNTPLPLVWTNASTATANFYLYVKSDLRLQLVIGSAMPGLMDTLQVSVDDAPVSLTRRETPFGTLFEGLISHHLVGLGKRHVVVTLQTGPTISPMSFDSTSVDTRRLGVGVRSLTLEPITNAVLTDFDGSESGRGWQPPETGADKTTFQRMDGAEASVQLPLMDAADTAVVFRVSNADSDAALNNLTLSVGDHSLPLTRVPSADVTGSIFQALIPRSAFAAGQARPSLTFKVASTANRPLAFDWLLTYPAQDTWLGMSLLPWGTGWGKLEGEIGSDRFRWMTAASSALDVPVVPNQPTTLQFDVYYTITPETVKSLRVSANGVPLMLTDETLDEGHVFTTVIPPQPSDSVKLTFTIDKTTSPADIGNSSDHRQLGLALKWLSFQPAP